MGSGPRCTTINALVCLKNFGVKNSPAFGHPLVFEAVLEKLTYQRRRDEGGVKERRKRNVISGKGMRKGRAGITGSRHRKRGKRVRKGLNGRRERDKEKGRKREKERPETKDEAKRV